MDATQDKLIEQIRDALSSVDDPELGVDIVSLGLIYSIRLLGAVAHITYTLTSAGCPVGPMIEREMRNAVGEVQGIEEVETVLVFDPPWSPDRISDDAKFLLGFG